MPRLDHMEVPVSDYGRTRDWYRDNLGFEVELEFPEARTVGMCDEADLTVFFHQGAPPTPSPGLSFTVQVEDVEAKAAELKAKGVAPPKKVYRGYGAEVLDPDGYRIRLWDEMSMKEKGGGG